MIKRLLLGLLGLLALLLLLAAALLVNTVRQGSRLRITRAIVHWYIQGYRPSQARGEKNIGGRKLWPHEKWPACAQRLVIGSQRTSTALKQM